MNDMQLLDPNTRSMISLNEVSKMGIETQKLIRMSINLYNKSLKFLKANEDELAWEYCQNAISIFPYLKEVLEYGFTLSLEFGKYEQAFSTLKKLRLLIPSDEYNELSSSIEKELKTYNGLLTGDSGTSNLNKDSRLIHLIIGGLIHPKLKEQEFYNNVIQKTNVISFESSIGKKINLSKEVAFGILSVVILFLIVTGYNARQHGQLLLVELETMKSKVSILDSAIIVKSSEAIFLNDMNMLFTAYRMKNFTECGDILLNNPIIVDSLIIEDTNILDQICMKLYGRGMYNQLLEINYRSKFHIHADFQKVMDSEEAERIKLKSHFVNRYPHSEMYTAPFLRELYDIEVDSFLRSKYANALNSLVAKHPGKELEKYISKKIGLELE